MNRHVWCAVMAWQLLFGVAGAQELRPGTVIEKVVCRGDAAQAYALYLPSTYSRDRSWPILYAFDAGARGLLAVERFRDAAERFGFIVAGSRNSRNGPMEVAQQALNALLADTQARLSVDPRRMYMTGFSGGARVAAAAGLGAPGAVAGVIGFGAGFPAGRSAVTSVPFAYFSAAGTGDFNYGELDTLDRALGRLGVAHRFESFDGAHDWPPPVVCAHALEWMVLQSMRSGRWPPDAGLVDRLYVAALDEAAAEERAGRAFLAFVRYEAIARDYAGLREVAAASKKAKELRQVRAVKQALADLAAADREQQQVTARLFGLVREVVEGEAQAEASRELLGELAGLRRDAGAPAHGRAWMVAQRVLTAAWVALNESVTEDFTRRDFVRAAARLRILTSVRPESFAAEYALARACARCGQVKEALQALARAVEKGFRDKAALRAEPDFESLRSDPAFGRLLEGIRGPG